MSCLCTWVVSALRAHICASPLPHTPDAALGSLSFWSCFHFVGPCRWKKKMSGLKYLDLCPPRVSLSLTGRSPPSSLFWLFFSWSSLPRCDSERTVHPLWARQKPAQSHVISTHDEHTSHVVATTSRGAKKNPRWSKQGEPRSQDPSLRGDPLGVHLNLHQQRMKPGHLRTVWIKLVLYEYL